MKTVEDVCREVNICEQTFYRWRRKYGRMEMADAKKYKELMNLSSCNYRLTTALFDDWILVAIRWIQLPH